MPKDFSIYDQEFTASGGSHAGAGGRISSPKLRRSLEMAEDFTGLEENIKRYDLLVLVKRAGRSAGFTPRMIELLDYYMAYTRDCDWEQGSRPIVYQSLAKTSLDLGVSERQIQKLENALFEIGALTWNDSGNHRRYGQRDPQSGRILYAYGVDLTPLAYLRGELQRKLEEKQLYDQAWLKTKRDISSRRRQIKALMAELEGQGADTGAYINAYERIALPIRTYMELDSLRDLLARHNELTQTLLNKIKEHQKQSVKDSNDSKMPHKSSCTDDSSFVSYNTSTQELLNQSNNELADISCSDKRSCLRKDVAAAAEGKTKRTERGAPKQEEGSGDNPDKGDTLILSTGLQHITLKQALAATSERFRERIPLKGQALSWADMIEAAYNLKSELHISQKSWARACDLLGRTGAAVCLILTDRAAQRESEPVRKPAAYFNAMLSRAESGDLHLHNSIFGLLDRDS